MYNDIRSSEEIIEAIIEYFEEHEDRFNICVEDLDNSTGYLGSDRFYPMDEFEDCNHKSRLSEIDGFDIETWGDVVLGESNPPFNPNRKYFTENGCGQLISSDRKDYWNYLGEDTVEEMAEHRVCIDGIDEDDDLSELFDELKAAQDAEFYGDEDY